MRSSACSLLLLAAGKLARLMVLASGQSHREQRLHCPLVRGSGPPRQMGVPVIPEEFGLVLTGDGLVRVGVSTLR
jgi:hypothetical protein